MSRKTQAAIILVLVAIAAIAYAGTATLRPYGIQLGEMAAPSTPPSGWGTLYVDTSGVLYFKNDAGTATDLISAATASAWDDLTSPDANKTHAFTTYTSTLTGTSTAADQWTWQALGAFGDVSAFVLEQKTGNPTDGTLLELKLADTDPDFVSMAAGGVEKVNIDSSGNVTLSSGDLTLTAGDLTVGGTFYQAAIAAAASGNANLTIDAAGTGTITLGGTSTGLITTDNAVQLYGNTDIGNAATDTLTITSIIDGNVTLDDGTTDSPSLILKDATDETGTLVKADGDNVKLTTTATEGLEIVTGNLWVGDGSPGTASMDGEDFYVNGDSEFDGAITADGAVTLNSTAALNGTTTWTLGATELVVIDGDATDQTQTAGTVNIDVGTATNGVSGVNSKLTYTTGGVGEAAYNVKLDVDDDTSSAGYLYGLYVDSSDATGSSEVIGLYTGNTIDTGLKQLVGAANTAITTDANTTDSTNTGGVWKLDVGTVTNGNVGALVDYNVGDTGAGVTATAIKVDLDDDTSSNAATINGVWAYSADLTGEADTVVRGFYTSGCDVAFQADNGYVRIGTGSTPGVTPGDDDLYVEGTVEIDGNLYPDGNIVGDGATVLSGTVSTVTDGADGTPYTVTIAMAGNTFYNSQAIQFNLPEASTCIGARYTFAVLHASNLDVNPDDGDLIVAATSDAGDMIRSATVGDTVTLQAVSASQWVVVSMYPASTDWTDAN